MAKTITITITLPPGATRFNTQNVLAEICSMMAEHDVPADAVEITEAGQ